MWGQCSGCPTSGRFCQKWGFSSEASKNDFAHFSCGLILVPMAAARYCWAAGRTRRPPLHKLGQLRQLRAPTLIRELPDSP